MVADDVCEELIASDNKARVYELHLKMLLCEVLSLNQKNAQSGNISVSVIYNVYICVCVCLCYILYGNRKTSPLQ